jgi:hypothetical protein
MERFYQTVGGRRFIDGTMPKLVDELARLNRNLEALVAALVAKAPPPAPTATADDGQR